jgi:hypothetical protein
MDDILVEIAKADGVLQKMDMGKDISTQSIPQKADRDTNFNIDPTSQVIQIPIFGATLERSPFHLNL